MTPDDEAVELRRDALMLRLRDEAFDEPDICSDDELMVGWEGKLPLFSSGVNWGDGPLSVSAGVGAQSFNIARTRGPSLATVLLCHVEDVLDQHKESDEDLAEELRAMTRFLIRWLDRLETQP